MQDLDGGRVQVYARTRRGVAVVFLSAMSFGRDRRRPPSDRNRHRFAENLQSTRLVSTSSPLRSA